MKNSRIVITGGNGFIGSNLIKKLLEKGYTDIISLDRSNYPDSQAKTVMGNFGDEKILDQIIKQDDIVIHLACSSAPAISELDKERDLKENVFGTFKLLEVSARRKINKFIFFSSGGTIYGNHTQAVKEETETNPTNSHGLMKLSIEKEIKLFNQLHNLDYIIVRPSNPYGRERDNKKNQGVIDILIKKILNKENIEIWGDGEIVRDYIHIEDLSDFIMKILEKDAKNEIFNIGTGIGTSVNQIIDILKNVSNEKFDIKYLPSRSFDIPYNVLDISKSKKILDWEPKIKIDEGIKNIFNKLKK